LSAVCKEKTMRTIVGLTVAAVTLWASAGGVRAGERETALAVIEQAIKAHGGEEGLVKAQRASLTGSGVLTLAGKELPFTAEVLSSLPDRLRVASNLEVEPGKKSAVILAVNGDKGWISQFGSVTDLGKERFEELREEAYVQWLATLVPLRKDTFDLAPVPEIKVNDKPAAGVKVSRKGHNDVKLYFDKASGLLVKIERRAREAGLQVDKEYVYSEHKAFDGVKLPTRQVEMLNGKTFTQLSSATYKFLDKVDAAAFDKP
jgi:hypothetical protein